MNTLSLVAAFAVSLAAQDESTGADPDDGARPSARAAAPVSVEVLRSRSEYSALDRAAVEAVARAAQLQWPEELSDFTYQRVEHFAAGGVSHWISIWSHGKTGLEFALVPGGTFQMGSPDGEASREADEFQNRVTLDPFLIARTEFTQGAWAQLAKAAGLDGDSFVEAAREPMVGMSPAEVETWCRHAGLALPTEAQWEYMCRAGTTSAWAMGDDKQDLREFANLGSAECPESWHAMPGITEAWYDGYGIERAPVGEFAANAFGLFDVHGNVSEWTRDHYFSYAVPVEPGTGARLGNSGERMARGGNGGGDAAFARSASRFMCGAGVSPGGNKGLGFRPAVDLPFAISLEGWPAETFALPPGFAQDLPAGTESLRFAPGWRDPYTEEFWSYAFIMWSDEPAPDATRIGELLDGYYDGLMLTFAGNAGKDIGSDPAQVEVTAPWPGHFEAHMRTVDAFATFETMYIRILVDVIAQSDQRSAVRIRISPQPAEHAIWRALAVAVSSIEQP